MERSIDSQVTCFLCDNQTDVDQTMRVGNHLICVDCLEDLDEALDDMKRRLPCSRPSPAAA